MNAPNNGVGYADITALAQSLSSAGGTLHGNAVGLIRDATQATEMYAREYAPVRSGALRGSITGHADGLTGVVSASVPYAIFVELGTGIRGEFPTHMITIQAKPGKQLSWIGSNGRRVYAKSVRSPGMKARPYLRPGLEQAIDELEQALQTQAILSIVKGPGA